MKKTTGRIPLLLAAVATAFFARQVSLADTQDIPGPLSAAHAAKPASSNDLMPASGTIEVRQRRPPPARPAHAPVEVTEEPPPAPPRPPTPAPVPARVARPLPRRAAAPARKRAPEHPVRFYVLLGVAIGIGIVLAYWFSQYFPYGPR